MSLDLVVLGDPEECRGAAHRLTTIAAATQSTGDCLAHAAGIAEADFDGRAGDAFRAHARTLATSADDTSHRCRRVARALSELALDLEDVRRVMARARAAAEPWLVVSGGAILPPHGVDEAFPEAARAAWEVAAQLVAEARRIESRAQLDWAGCVRQVAQELPLYPYDPTRGPHLTADPPAPGDPAPGHPDDADPVEPATLASATPAPAPASAGAPPPYVAPPSTGPASEAAHAASGPTTRPGEPGFGHLPTLGVGHLPEPEVTPPTCGTPTTAEVSDERR